MQKIKIRTIKQEDNTGCGVACVAMLASTTYDKIRNKMITNNCVETNRKRGVFPTNGKQLIKTLGLFGIKAEQITYKKDKPWKEINKAAIVGVNHKEKPMGGDYDEWHWVVKTTDGWCLDPNKVVTSPSKRLRKHIKHVIYITNKEYLI